MDKAPDAFRTISEVAEELEIPQHVLRFWETRFAQIKPMKRSGGRRYYRPDDVDLLKGIRRLLYGEGYTIRGVQRILKDNGVKFVQNVWQAGAPQPAKLPRDADEAPQVTPQVPEAAAPRGPQVAPAVTEAAAPRGRGLFGILPLLQGETEDLSPERGPAAQQPLVQREEVRASPPPPVDRREASPPLHPVQPLRPRSVVDDPAPAIPPRVSADAPAPAGTGKAGLARDHLQKLQATLYELSECRRLIDATMDDRS